MSEDRHIRNARKRVEQKAEALRLKKERKQYLLDERIADMTRVSGEAECLICHRKWKEHPYFKGHKIDDGTGRMIPWLREACNGKLVKL